MIYIKSYDSIILDKLAGFEPLQVYKLTYQEEKDITSNLNSCNRVLNQYIYISYPDYEFVKFDYNGIITPTNDTQRAITMIIARSNFQDDPFTVYGYRDNLKIKLYTATWHDNSVVGVPIGSATVENKDAKTLARIVTKFPTISKAILKEKNATGKITVPILWFDKVEWIGTNRYFIDGKELTKAEVEFIEKYGMDKFKKSKQFDL